MEMFWRTKGKRIAAWLMIALIMATTIPFGSISASADNTATGCFGCGKGGGAINFVMELENLSFREAVEVLAKRAGMEVPDEEGDREAGRRRQRLLDLTFMKWLVGKFFNSLLLCMNRILPSADLVHRLISPPKHLI